LLWVPPWFLSLNGRKPAQNLELSVLLRGLFCMPGTLDSFLSGLPSGPFSHKQHVAALVYVQFFLHKSKLELVYPPPPPPPIPPVTDGLFQDLSLYFSVILPLEGFRSFRVGGFFARLDLPFTDAFLTAQCTVLTSESLWSIRRWN